MNTTGKVWGSTSLLFQKNNVEIHRLVGKRGGFCSYHKHQHKYNMFFVECGKLQIKTQKDSGIQDITTLTTGQTCIVEPDQFHQFKVLEAGIFFEIYWTELKTDDIERVDAGGVEND